MNSWQSGQILSPCPVYIYIYIYICILGLHAAAETSHIIQTVRFLSGSVGSRAANRTKHIRQYARTHTHTHTRPLHRSINKHRTGSETKYRIRAVDSQHEISTRTETDQALRPTDRPTDRAGFSFSSCNACRC